jgi:quercetin dioxygenase-like cupin family protein
MKSQQLTWIVLGSVLSAACQAARAAPPTQKASPPPTAASEVKRELIAQKELADLPGWESRLYLIEFPAGVVSQVHEHLTPGIGYVLEGSFESSFGDAPAIVKHAGEGFIDLPNLPHHFRNPDPAHRLRFVISGTFRKNDPLFRPLPQ